MQQCVIMGGYGRHFKFNQIQLYREHFVVSKEMSWPTKHTTTFSWRGWVWKEKQKYTGDIGDMIPITVYTSLKSPCRDISYPFISSVTCKLLQVLLKFFHLLPDRLHLASEISTARINGVFLTRWRAVFGQRTEELCFPARGGDCKKNGSTQSQHLYTNLWNQKTNRPLATCLSGSPRTVNNQHDKTSAGIWWIHHSLKPAMPKIKRPGNAV